MDITHFKALSFDCYGTLIDWEQGILNVLQPWISSQGATFSEEELLNTYARVEAQVEKDNPGWKYQDILREVAIQLGTDLGLEADSSYQEALSHSVGDWPAFPDTVEALKILESRFKLIILSNIDEVSFKATNSQQLGIDFHKIITAERVGSYKPNPAHFKLMVREMEVEGITQKEILHVAQSLFHDMEPATALGFNTVWINRRINKPGFGATPAPVTEVKPDLEFPTLGAFADYVQQELPR